MKHIDVIDRARVATESLLRSDLTPDQQQLVVDMMNAMQDLNVLYCEKVFTVAEASPATRPQHSHPSTPASPQQ